MNLDQDRGFEQNLTDSGSGQWHQTEDAQAAYQQSAGTGDDLSRNLRRLSVLEGWLSSKETESWADSIQTDAWKHDAGWALPGTGTHTAKQVATSTVVLVEAAVQGKQSIIEALGDAYNVLLLEENSKA